MWVVSEQSFTELHCLHLALFWISLWRKWGTGQQTLSMICLVWLSLNSAAKKKIRKKKTKVFVVWFRWFLRHRWLWCHRFKPIMGLAVWGTLPRVLLSSGQIAGYYNTVASSIAFTHLQNNSFISLSYFCWFHLWINNASQSVFSKRVDHMFW